MNKYFLIGVFLVFSLFLTGCVSNRGSETLAVDRDSQIIFFYGQECPHCGIVEDYIKKNNVSEKIDFAQGESYHNKGNAEFMMEKQKECQIDEKMIGAVPFLWTADKCYLGQEDIIQFFEDKINEK